MTKQHVPTLEEIRSTILLWCSRHCCFCGKPCTTNIEIHHIDGNHDNNEIDNLCPVCFDCHGELGRYNVKHPRGTNYKNIEIKKRREQIYEKYTIQYVRPVHILISKYINPGAVKQKKRSPGDHSFIVSYLSNDISCKLNIVINYFHNDKKIEIDFGPLYSGKALWNLLPQFTVGGHFKIPNFSDLKPFHFRTEVCWSIIDVLDREHHMPPFSYVWDNPKTDWWYDPQVIHG